jgi:prophage DNA circulation protein
MTTAEQENEQLRNGAASWKDRIAEYLTLTSPSGLTFDARWLNGPRNKGKRLGIFDYPEVDGTLVQDLGISGNRYSLTFYFEGRNHDLVAERFYIACDERGPWSFNHPTKGFMELQLNTVEEMIDPTGSGNITGFTTEWIEALDEETLQTARQLYGVIDAAKNDYDALAKESYTVTTDTAGEEAAAAQTAEKIATAANKYLGGMASGYDDVATAVAAAQAGLAETVAADSLDPVVLAGYTQALISKPALGSEDITDRLNQYTDLIDEMIGMLPDTGTSATDRNKALTIELGLSAAVGTCAQIVTTGSLKTRVQAAQVADQLATIIGTVTDALDSTQEMFEDLDIDNQYFSQKASYNQAQKIITTAQAFLLGSAYNLKIEKRFTLNQPSTPAMIVLDQYPEGNFEQDFDSFISANDLHGDDILWLPSGREVVVYA